MELRQTLQTKLEQRLTLTLQLQQAIKLLQLTRLELANVIQQELAENPVLEEIPAPSAEEIPVSNLDYNGASDEQGEAGVVQQDHEQDWRKVIEEFGEAGPLPSTIVRRDEELPPMEANLTRKDDLQDHLLWQLKMSSMDEQSQRIAYEIIGDVDSNGYVPEDEAQALADRLRVSPDEVERVLGVVQLFDPLGVAARTLVECLTIQARVLYPGDDIVMRVIRDHLNDLVGRAVLSLPQKLGVNADEVDEIRMLIAALDPKPGRNFTGDEVQYVTPDVYVLKRGDEYYCSLNEDGLPKLKLSPYYKNLINRPINNETKDYLKKKVQSAVWFMKSIHQRQSTVLLVAESIVKFQKDFLDNGISHLKPLILRDVADEIGMHECTVSRVTSNKYIHTPQGLYSLKFFFNSRIETSDGEDVASQAVRDRIKQIVEGEDPSKPVSDQQLVELLEKEGIHIARRTVAKYRTQLGILSSSQRVRIPQG